MRKMLTVGLVSIGMVLGAYSAQAGDRHYKGKYHGYSGYHHGIGDEALIAAGIFGGLILLSSLLSRPQYPPATVHYAPRHAPRCHQDRVHRHLPDGRIQWGTTTHCY